MFNPFSIIERFPLSFKLNLPSYWALLYISFISLVSIYSMQTLYGTYSSIFSKEIEKSYITQEINYEIFSLYRIRTDISSGCLNEESFSGLKNELYNLGQLFIKLDHYKESMTSYKVDAARKAFEAYKTILLDSMAIQDMLERKEFLKKNYPALKNSIDTVMRNFSDIHIIGKQAYEQNLEEISALREKMTKALIILVLFVILIYITYALYIRNELEKHLKTIFQKIDIIKKRDFSSFLIEEEEEEEEKKTKNQLKVIDSALFQAIHLLALEMEEEKRNLKSQKEIIEISTTLRGNRSSQDVIDIFLDWIVQRMNALSASFYLFDYEQKALVLRAFCGETKPKESINLDEGIIGKVATWRTPLSLHVENQSVMVGTSNIPLQTTYLHPFKDGSKLLGVLEISSHDDFLLEDKELLEKIDSLICKRVFSALEREKEKALLTKIQKQASELQKAYSYKSQFLATMSHELRTPLNAINTLSQLMLRNKNNALDSASLEKIKAINYAGRDLLTLIEDILDLSKIEAKKMEIKNEKVFLERLGDDIISLFKHQCDDKEISLTYTKQGLEKLPYIFSDAQKIEQIIKNFFSNALKFTSKKGEIHLDIAYELQGDFPIRISVKDSGIGISKENLEKIFEAFAQEDGSISREFGGTGLGLSISKELAHLLKGKIEVSSQKGRGATFTLLLPASSQDSVSHTKNSLHVKKQMAKLHLILVSKNIEKILTLIAQNKHENLQLTYALDKDELSSDVMPNAIFIDEIDDDEVARVINQRLKESLDV